MIRNVLEIILKVLFGGILCAAAVQDARERRISDRYHAMILALAVLSMLLLCCAETAGAGGVDDTFAGGGLDSAGVEFRSGGGEVDSAGAEPVSAGQMLRELWDVCGPAVGFAFAGGLCVSGPMLLLALLRPGAFGGGDIKLTAVCGLFLGAQAMALSAVAAVASAGVYAVWLLIRRGAGRKTEFAFGPFLCFGMILTLLFTL